MVELNKLDAVLIADRIEIDYADFDESSTELEKIPDSYFQKVSNGLLSIVNSVFHYNSPKEFTNNIGKHKNDIVFTIYGGANSRNRMSLIPSICEANDIHFVGADAYARFLCQDKHLSKVFANQFNIRYPKSHLIYKIDDCGILDSLNFPLIVKPNFEGSSIGITNDCIVHTKNEAIEKSKELLLKFSPLIVEEFVPGPECCICVSGTMNKIFHFNAVEIYNISNKNYFESKLYTSEAKHKSKQFDQRIVEVNELDRTRIEKMFMSLGKLDYLRVDGKLNNGEFTLFELTPDSYFGEGCSFEFAYKEQNKSYEEMIKEFIKISFLNYQIQYSSV